MRTTAKIFTFLTNLMTKLSVDKLYNRCFVLDNVPFHRMTVINELIESHGHRVLFLPPYSPQLNPIEEVFSKWKGIVKDSNSDSQ
jgi:transposase